jgi:hypothetical protein
MTTLADLNLTEWWDISQSWDDPSKTSLGVLQGTPIAPNGRGSPVLVDEGMPARKSLSFGATHALRTPFSSTYRSIFAGNCTLIMLAKFASTGGSRCMVAGRQASWGGVGNGVIDVGQDTASNIHYTQLYDGSSNAATIPARTTPVLLAVRKVGLTVQICSLYDDDTMLASAVSGNGPSITDIEYFCLGGGWHSANQGRDLQLYAGGFAPYAMSDAQLVALRDIAMPPKAPPYFSGLVEWWDPAQGLAATTWQGRHAGYTFEKLNPAHADLAAATVEGLSMVHVGTTALGTPRDGADVANVFNHGTLATCNKFATNNGQYGTPIAVGDWGAGLGAGSAGSNLTYLSVSQVDYPGSVGAMALQQYWEYFGGGSVTDGIVIANSNAAVANKVKAEAVTRKDSGALRYLRSDNLHVVGSCTPRSINNGAFRMNASYSYSPTMPGNFGDLYAGHTSAYNRDLAAHELWQLLTWKRKGWTYVPPRRPRRFGNVPGGVGQSKIYFLEDD